MATPVLPNLSFGQGQSLPSPGELLLITDHLDSSAEFILHKILATHLKEVQDSRTLIISFALEFSQWRAIASKSKINLTQLLSSDSFRYIDGLSASLKVTDDGLPYGAPLLYLCPELLSQTEGHGAGLRSLFVLIHRMNESWDKIVIRDVHRQAAQRTVIIDDISILELIGVPTNDLIDFVRALRALCRSKAASLIIRAHALSSSESNVPFDSELLRSLLGSCHTHVEVRPLGSGRSGAVSGEVTVHPGGLASQDAFVSVGRQAAMQYRLSDGGATFFQRGMGAGVL